MRAHIRERGLVVIISRDHRGGIEVQLPGEPEMLDRLRGDYGFAQYAQFRC